MPHPPQQANHDTPQADIFSRGSLQMTYTLLRKHNAQLALTVRNITGQNPVTNPSACEHKNTECFKVQMDSQQVRSVVENLVQVHEKLANSPHISAAGQAVMAKALIEDWMALAHLMIVRLQSQQ